jgi:regulator of sigma E protease
LDILSVILVIVLLILAHEFGHFLTAKLTGVKVEEFGLGFPPRLAAVRLGETLYSLNLLPLGGFVRLLGEEDPTNPRSLAGKRIPVRLLVLCAGSLMNILLPLFLFAASYVIPQETTVGKVIVGEVAPGSPAEQAGLAPGDQIVQAGGHDLLNNADLIYRIQLSLGSPLELLVQREGQPLDVKVVPRWRPPPEQGAVGVTVTTEDPQVQRISYPFWQAIPMGAETLVDTLKLFRNEIWGWFVRRTTPQVGGPIAIFQIGGEIARAGPGPLLAFAAFLSINLAIINLFPLPGLDGGRLAFVLLEAVRKKRISPRQENLVHLIGMLLLIGLLIVVSYYDLMRVMHQQ